MIHDEDMAQIVREAAAAVSSQLYVGELERESDTALPCG